MTFLAWNQKLGAFFDGRAKLSISRDDVLDGDLFFYGEPDMLPVGKIGDTFCGLVQVSSKKIYGTKKNKDIKEFVPYNEKVPKFLVAIDTQKYFQDCYVQIRYLEWNNTRYPVGGITEYLGNPSDTNDCYQFLIKNYQFHRKTFKQLESITENFKLKCSDRNDWTHLEPISIDPLGCTDIDDALSCQKVDGGYRIGVHIADVDSLVCGGSELDTWAKHNTTSLYLGKEVIHMLPVELSTNLLSLREGQERNVLSCFYLYDGKELHLEKVDLGVIRNRKEIDYDSAQNRIMEGDNEFGLVDLSNIFTKITGKEADTHQMIEYFMILYNRTVGKMIWDNYEKVILRIQQGTKDGWEIVPEEIVDIVRKFYYHRAVYSNDRQDVSHEALGIDYYTHGTSPLRRYADLCVHRMVKGILKGDLDTGINQDMIDWLNRKQKDAKRLEHAINILSFIDRVSESVALGAPIHAEAIVLRSNKEKTYVYIPKHNLTCSFFKLEREYEDFQKIRVALYVSRNNFRIESKIKVDVEDVEEGIGAC